MEAHWKPEQGLTGADMGWVMQRHEVRKFAVWPQPNQIPSWNSIHIEPTQVLKKHAGRGLDWIFF